MSTYAEMKRQSDVNGRFLESVYDNFLMYYVALKSGLAKEMDRQLKPYRRSMKHLLGRYEGYLKSAFIASQLFRKGGLLRRYMNHTLVKALPPEEYAWLEFQEQHPWRFSFAVLKEEREQHFFQMQDVFTGEEYLLYSPGLDTTRKERPIILWFNLIWFNGSCWETHGLIGGFNSFSPDDIFFFATEVNPNIEDDEMLLEEVARNPFPFYMLLSGANLPRLINKDDDVLYHMATVDLDVFDAEPLRKYCDLAWHDGVFQIRRKHEEENPNHFSRAYYDEQERILYRIASTRTGFQWMNHTLSRGGITLDPTPDFVVSPAMLITTEQILGKMPEIDPYSDLFVREVSEKDQEILDRMNEMLDHIVPLINANQPVDLDALSREFGFPEGAVRRTMEKIVERLQAKRRGE